MSYWEPGPKSPRDDIVGEPLQTITLTGEEAAVARRLLAKLGCENRLPTVIGSAADDDVMSVARAVYQSRKRRSIHFGSALFSEPAWDMLLVLFIYGDRGDRMSVTKLAEFSESPLTTAIRWLDYLESQRWIVRTPCPNDRRKFFVNLSDKGRSLMVTYFQSLIEGDDASLRT